MIHRSVSRRPSPSRRRMPAPLLFCGALAALTILSRHAATADEPTPLHQRIDALIAENTSGIAAPVVGDAEFLRRASLDLIGVPPSVDELRAFLADQNPAKRAAAVERLVNHPRHPRHLAELFDVWLMERRPAAYVSVDEWHQYLLSSFREKKPYNVLAREILAADGADPNPRAAVRFYLDRQADPNLLTRDVGRIFFGRDLQCAQCHDHPLVSDYHQADYHGLLAFLQSGALFTAPAPDGKTYYIEKAGAAAVFESVFISGKHATGPKLLGLVEIEEPLLYPGEQYEVKPADAVRPVPKFSRRAKLAELATNGTNRPFNENIANRLWAHMMGRGLVEPVDLHHAENPPSNPQLLRMLGDEFAAGGFNVTGFLQALALTQTYQRSVEPPADPAHYAAVATTVAAQFATRLQELDAATSAADQQYTLAAKECCAVEDAAAPVAAELDAATVAATDAAAKLDAAATQLAAVQSQVAAKSAVSQALTDAVAKTQEVAKALPQDAELIAAAEKFAQRQQQVVAEVATLAKDAEQKTAAVDASQQAVTTTRQGIDAVRTKLAPLADSLKQKKQLVAATRLSWAEQESTRASFEQRLDALQQLAQLKPLEEQLAASAARVAASETALADANKAVEAQAAAVAAAEQARVAAEAVLAQAAAASAAVQEECRQAEQLTAAVVEAVAKANIAGELIPGDPSLAQASAALDAALQEMKRREEAPRARLAEVVAHEENVRQQLAAATAQAQAAVTHSSQCREQVTQAEQALAAARAEGQELGAQQAAALHHLHSEWTQTFAALPLKPLTPEQMCWSILQITGVYDRYVAAEQAELDKAAPLSEADKADPAKLAARELDLQQRVYDKLKANVAVFAGLYAPAAGQPQDDFFASANQALFAANGGSITGWAAPASANITERVIQQPDPKAAAEELYLAILSRLPDEAEIADVTQYLAARPAEKPACVQELVWGLLTSVEFRFNH